MTHFSTRIAAVTLAAVSTVAMALLPGAALAELATPQPPMIAAKAWILMDGKTGAILTAQNADERLPPASLTKMMTTYVADYALHEKRIHMGDMVNVSEKAWRTGMKEGSRMYIEVGSQVSVEDLFRGIIIQSGNDASVALAEHVAGSEEQFVQLMNAQAKRLGMGNTLYMDASGLSDGQFSSARDLALLARAIIYDFPENYRMYSEKEFRYNIGRPQPNRNLLLFRDPTVDGLKTGHTKAAGFCLVASAKRGDTRLISVVLNTASENARADESAKLLDWGFRNFETYAPWPAGTTLGETVVWMGDADKVAIGIDQDIVLTIPRGSHDQLKAAITVQPEIRAPLAKGAVVGTFVIRSGEQVLVEKPLVAMADVPEGNLFKQFWHWLKLLFSGLFG
ncbi:MAG: D-alanyl-D-alanine carboxypeptidase family protein [Pseudomonadota bacterium]